MQKLSRDDIIARSVALFRRRGYRGTSMKDVGEACGILKGSLYHHFPAKEDILRAAVEDVAATFEAQVFAPALESSRPPRQRMIAMADAEEALFLDWRGCLAAQVALEDLRDVPDVPERVRAFFRRWADIIARTAAEGGRTDALAEAEDLVVRIEGAVLWLALFDDPAPLRRAIDAHRRMLD